VLSPKPLIFVPERFVDEAVVEKILVVVAFVKVALMEAISVNPRSVVRFGKVVVAFKRASKRPPKVVV
jgi:hypothetical protein